jgi:type II secretory pathway pseudopilin PulG
MSADVDGMRSRGSHWCHGSPGSPGSLGSPGSHGFGRVPRRRRASQIPSQQAGYAYLALLILIAIIGVAAAATAELGDVYRRRMAEKELLFVGGEFQRALSSYAAQTPLGQPTQPRTLDDLVHDPRYPNPVHHLRKVYADPMTGKADWVLVKSPDGQTIIGIHSASKAHPIQVAQFPDEFQGFEDQRSYTQWIFIARLTQTPGQRTAIAAPMVYQPNSGIINGNGTSSGAAQGSGTSSSNNPFGSGNGSSDPSGFGSNGSNVSNGSSAFGGTGGAQGFGGSGLSGLNDSGSSRNDTGFGERGPSTGSTGTGDSGQSSGGAIGE